MALDSSDDRLLVNELFPDDNINNPDELLQYEVTMFGKIKLIPIDWLEDNIHGKFMFVWGGVTNGCKYGISMKFELESDAVFFKLTWG